MKIGIIGYGFVGQAVHAIIKTDKVIIHDINKSKYFNNKSKILEASIVFVCVPTPQTTAGAQDASIVTGILEYLKTEKYNGIVVIKSTVMHTHIEPYEQALDLCFNPEFLNQNSSISDSIKQTTIILGGEMSVTKRIRSFYEVYTTLNEPEFEFMPIKEACDFKYTRNLYGAYKVLFWEFIQDTTGNARKMAELYHKMPYQSEMSQVGMDGNRGFSGACFPKDVSAWNTAYKHQLTEFMNTYNAALNKK